MKTDYVLKGIIFFWITLAAFLFIFFLQGCQATAPAAPQSSCLFKISVGNPFFKDGIYKSAPLTQPLGTVSRMEMRAEKNRIYLHTIRGNGMEATPETGIDSLMDYEISNNYLLVGSFRADARDADSVTLKITWQSRDFDLVWVKELQYSTGIYVDPHPPQGPMGCPE